MQDNKIVKENVLSLSLQQFNRNLLVKLQWREERLFQNDFVQPSIS